MPYAGGITLGKFGYAAARERLGCADCGGFRVSRTRRVVVGPSAEGSRRRGAACVVARSVTEAKRKFEARQVARVRSIHPRQVFSFRISRLIRGRKRPKRRSLPRTGDVIFLPKP